MGTQEKTPDRGWLSGIAVIITITIAAATVMVFNAPGNPAQADPTIELESGADQLSAQHREAAKIEPSEQQMQRLAADNNAFACDMYAELASKEEGNLTYSPFSISFALAMVNAGARGNTKAEIKDAMHFTLDDAALVRAFGDQCYRFDQLTEKLRRQAGDDAANGIFAANSAWIDHSVDLVPAYEQVITDGFKALVRTIDFQDPPAVVKAINGWTAEQTRDKIPEVLGLADIKPTTVMALVSCLTFDLSWQENWHYLVEDGPFLLITGQPVEVPMLKTTWVAPLAITDTYSALNIPLRDRDMSLVLILPNELDGLAELESQLSGELIAAIGAELVPAEVTMTFPKFKLDDRIKVKPMLQALGINDAFTMAADLSGIGTAGGDELYVDEVIHGADTEVNEKGVGAAAATVVLIGRKGGPVYDEMPERQAEFTADHPFLFLIQDNVTGAVLFMGRVLDPTQG
ncbi:serpin family protein [bacterium]|nr:serpin family protein [bacterium]